METFIRNMTLPGYPPFVSSLGSLNSIPKAFQNYKQFVKTYALAQGNVVTYKLMLSEGDFRHYQLCCNSNHNSSVPNIMTVSEWDNWYQQNKVDIANGSCESLLYLVNIGVSSLHHRQLQQALPDTLGKWSDMGPHSLSRFISEYSYHIPFPDMEARLYLSPPTPGGIVTPPHLDGFGTQTSVHAVLFGKGCHNVVQYWDRIQHLPTAELEQQFRDSVLLAKTPESADDFHLPHSKSFAFCTDVNNNFKGRYSWDCYVFNNKSENNNDNLLKGSTLTVSPGQVVFLPANTYHAFAKQHSMPVCFETGKEVDNLLEPMLGYAGDVTYLGESEFECQQQLQSLRSINTNLARLRVPTYVYDDLAILLFFLAPRCWQELSDTDKMYAKCMFPILQNEILKQADQVLERYTMPLFVDSKEMSEEEEYNCGHCLRGIALLYAEELHPLQKDNLMNKKRKARSPEQATTDKVNFQKLICSGCLLSFDCSGISIRLRCRFGSPDKIRTHCLRFAGLCASSSIKQEQC